MRKNSYNTFNFLKNKAFQGDIRLNKLSFVYKILFKCKELDTLKFHTNAILTHRILFKKIKKKSVRTSQRTQSYLSCEDLSAIVV